MGVAKEYFKVGGPLSEGTPSYIERPADQELLDALERRELCLVLGPRQMGKTSLMVHAISLLKTIGMRSGIVDLQHLGSQKDPATWFSDVAYQIKRSLRLKTNSVEWWRANSGLGPTQRFRAFLEDVVLSEVTGDVVIFIDEIDSVLPLPFSDDFFTTIRSIYNARSTTPDLERLNFVLSGVATPSAFIRDRSRTPFNIGQVITLGDFDRESTEQFQQVLGEESKQLIDRIFYWTDGQPFLVQQLAAAAYSWPEDIRSTERIDEEVRSAYLERKIEFDPHLKFIQDYLLADTDNLRNVLGTYRSVLTGRDVSEDERSPVQSQLKLAGVIKAEGKKLVIRNRIYESVFDLQWVSQHIREFFNVGGPLRRDSPSYIERPADQELFSALERRELCLILGPRQMGKTSLMVHAISRLREKGKKAGIVDLTFIGRHTDPDTWYLNIAELIGNNFELRTDSVEWWRANSGLGPTQRFRAFLEDVVLSEVTGDVVIFIDEIDYLLGQPFSDDFFTTIRSIYNARSTTPDLERLNFVLSGVATPSAFIRDRSRTPFNIGQVITLGDFDRESMTSFEQVLGSSGKQLIDRVFYWTDGHPSFTHRLAAAAYSWPEDIRSTERIDEEVRSAYLERKIESDSYLEFIQRVLLSNPNLTRKVLSTYRQILKGREVAEDERSPVQSQLKLAGVIKAEGKKLVIRNRIYESVFDLQWVGQHIDNRFPISAYAIWEYLGVQTKSLKILILLFITGLPLIAWNWQLLKDKSKVRPLYGTLAVVLYGVVLLILAFGKRIWAKRLEGDAIKLTVRWARSAIRGVSSGFRRRYLKHVLQDHSIFNVRGLGLINTFSLRLEEVFVELRVSPNHLHRVKADLIETKSKDDNHSIWDFLRGSPSVHNGSAVVIVGPPGSGKTTLLRHVAVTMAANRQYRYGVRAYTPIFLSLRNHTRDILGIQSIPLGELTQDYFGDPSLNLKPPSGWFEQELARGKCIVLLDGLDEVSDADARRGVSAWVDSQIRSYPRSRFVITARPLGYATAPLTHATVLEVQPFNVEQVRHFVENWYLANEVASSMRLDEAVRERALNEADDLLQRLQSLPAVKDLTVNPLLLTMVAMVHRYRGALPGTRVELYSEICEVLLGRWRQSRGLDDYLSSKQKLAVLRPLAAHMMHERLRDISQHQLINIISKPLNRIGFQGKSIEEFLTDIQSSSGLLLEREAGYWGFVSLSFQEYLTSAHWLDQRQIKHHWNEMVDDSWWHETLRLYAAQTDATPIVEACLEVNTVNALTLASDLIKEARSLTPEVRRAADERLLHDIYGLSGPPKFSILDR